METITINDNDYPKQLKKIKNPPEILYLEGNKELLYTNIISIVGTRKCSEYGINTTKKFVKEFASKNYRPALLFEDEEILERISAHPMALWRVRENNN